MRDPHSGPNNGTTADNCTDTGTDWSRLTRYWCNCCGDECINDYGGLRAQLQLCATCVKAPDLQDLDRLDGDLRPRQAADLVSGRAKASERSEREPAPGGTARDRSDSEDPGTSPGVRSERSEVLKSDR